MDAEKLIIALTLIVRHKKGETAAYEKLIEFLKEEAELEKRNAAAKR